METLFTAFKGSKNSSSKILKLANVKNKLFLDNDKEKSCIQLESELRRKQYDNIIMLGQKPNIVDKFYIELLSKNGTNVLKTKMDLNYLKQIIKNNHLEYRQSQNPGTSYCNNIYYFALNYITINNLKSNAAFLHVPYLNNIEKMNNFIKAIEKL